jgi:hypothetical protein
MEELSSNAFSLLLQQSADFAILKSSNNDEFSIMLTDLSGRTLQRNDIIGSFEYNLDLANLNKGFYFLSVQVKGKTESVFKIVR